MTAGRRDLERAARAPLPAHVREVGRRELDGRGRLLGRRRRPLAAEVGHGLGEMTNRHGLDAREGDLGARFGGTDEALDAGASGAFGSRKCARDGPEPTVERELSDRSVALEAVGRDLARGRKDSKRDRQVEVRALLAEIGRREVDGDPAPGPLELGGGNAAADAVLRLLAGAIGEPDDRERWHAVLQVRLHLDPTRSRPKSACAVVRASTLPR